MRTATIATALLALCAAFPVCGAEPPPVASETGRVAPGMVDRTTRCAIGRFKKCDIQIAVAHGLFETGLRPRFPEGIECRDIDEGYAIPYGFKRDRESYHSGIDMPAPTGTPVIAAAAGTVVGKFEGERSNRGIEVVLRHAPEDTDLRDRAACPVGGHSGLWCGTAAGRIRNGAGRPGHGGPDHALRDRPVQKM